MAALMVTMPALAGGWAVVTLDQLPARVIAGQPLTIGFTVRQHGRTLRNDLAPIVRLDRTDAQGSLAVTATREGDAGHYAATLTLPNAGMWNWRVDVEAFGMLSQPFPPLTVLDSAPSVHASASSSLPLAVGILGMAGAAGALFVSLRTRVRWVIALVLVGVVIGGVGFASAASQTAVAPSQAAPSNRAELGEALFLAKGCAMCHQQDAVRSAGKDFGTIGIGPNLTNLKADPDFLRRWLKDPSAVKPGTEMPTLGLSDGEIEALVAFLGAGANR
jgi:cytochrome c oxidase subunit 2